MAEREALPLEELPGEAPKLPGTLGSLRPPLLNVLLFVLTALSAFYMGSELIDTALPRPTQHEKLINGLSFAGSLIAILLSHEMGHFSLARRHGVDATWPFFIPAPLLSLIGTLGAVMKLRSLPRTRTALIDIAVAGPIAGFVVTIPVLAVGLWLSPVVPAEAASRHWTLARAFESLLRDGHWLGIKEGFDLGRPLLMVLMEGLIRPGLTAGQSLALHPVAIAGWFGLLLTALNLLPLGQLDGGHIVFGASPKLHRLLGPPISGMLIGLGVYTPFVGWLLWGLLTGLWFNRHPPLADPEMQLDGRRRILILVALAVFVLSFVPAPLMPIAAS
jgi:membrane-associated protease RseP (regulator of RpoE activity)